MASFGIVLFLLIPIAIIGAVGAVVYFLVKGNQAPGEGLSFRNLLRAYLRLAYLISLVVFLVGSVFTLTAALGSVFGRDFSYGRDFYVGSSGPATGQPCKSPPDSLSPSSPPCVPDGPPSPQSDQRPQDDLIRGISMMLAGLIIGGGHRLGQLRMESAEERRRSMLARAESLIATVGFGITSIIAIPLATYDVLRYAILGTQNLGGGSPEVPGPALAAALVFTPAWAFYLLSFIRAAQRPADRPAD